MADRLMAKGGGAKFTPHPEGQYVARCVDVIDLGLKIDDYPGQDKKLSHKCAIVFRTGEANADGTLIDASGEYTVSMNEKAKLRAVLESWRGKGYTEAEEIDGVPLDKLSGKYALLNIGHKTSSKGRTYAVILGVMGVPKSMTLPTLPPYVRADFWAERTAEYLKQADSYRVEIGIDRAGNPLSKQGRVQPSDSGGIGYPDDDTVFGGDAPEEEALPF